MTRARCWQNTGLCKYYARAVAVVLVLMGLDGLRNSLGLNTPWVVDLYHVSVGLFFAYAGFYVRDREEVRQIIEGLGMLMAVVAMAMILAFLLLGMHTPLWGPIQTIPLALGVSSILAAKILRDIQTDGRVR